MRLNPVVALSDRNGHVSRNEAISGFARSCGFGKPITFRCCGSRFRLRTAYYQVRTEECHGVLHIFWAWRVPDCERHRRFWIAQPWLSAQWEALHGAPVVWIKAYEAGQRSRNRLSRYVISQYVQDQSGYVNMCWSWKRSLGFPMSTLWEEMRNQWSSRNVFRRIRGELEILVRSHLLRTDWCHL